ncbi:alpha/beta hydrolase-fold protein [Streptomyces rectiverticillatus]|uniref:alpha/beta hydrolase-fold protein n=1 Tax=Streptomyces rectiverticillatus TaxID=173860 RepID=UPI003CCD808C
MASSPFRRPPARRPLPAVRLPVRLRRVTVALAALAAALLAPGVPSAQADEPAPPEMTDGFGLPDGGRRGWYANWLDQKTAAGAQNWENFHINQVIPFIDANLRTVAARQGRAVGGLSMGGFGALH